MYSNSICCVECETIFVPLKNEAIVLEMIDGRWRKLWAADLVHCPECDFRVVTGFGAHPIAEHYMPNFDETLTRLVESSMPIFFIDGKRRALVDFDGDDHRSKYKRLLACVADGSPT